MGMTIFVSLRSYNLIETSWMVGRVAVCRLRYQLLRPQGVASGADDRYSIACSLVDPL